MSACVLDNDANAAQQSQILCDSRNLSEVEAVFNVYTIISLLSLVSPLLVSLPHRHTVQTQCACQALPHNAVCTLFVQSPTLNSIVCFAVAKTTGSVLGVTVGCLLGMCPLLWMDSPRRETHDQPE